MIEKVALPYLVFALVERGNVTQTFVELSVPDAMTAETEPGNMRPIGRNENCCVMSCVRT